MIKYTFTDEGTGETLKVMRSDKPLSDRAIEEAIDTIEDETGCYVEYDEETE